MSTAATEVSLLDLEARLAAVPEHLIGEILGGELVVSPRPRFGHGEVAIDVTTDLRRFRVGRSGPGDWRFAIEPELQLAQDVLIPDIAGWRVERFTEGREVARVHTVPDWVCEILSPSTARLDRHQKARLYRAAGVPWMWLVDLDARVVEVYRGEGAFWVRVATGTDERDARFPPFEAAALDLPRWWGESAPETPTATPDPAPGHAQGTPDADSAAGSREAGTAPPQKDPTSA